MSKKQPLTRKQKRLLKKRRRRRILFGIEIFILLILIAGVFIYAKLGKMNFTSLDFSKIGVNSGVSNNKVMKGYTTIGLVGLDNRSNKLKSGNSDTMIIASIDNDTKKVKLVSVYRDTYLRIGEDSEGNGQYNRANAAYAKGGAEQFLNMLNTNLDLNVTDFVSVDFQAVAEAVELLGGIDVELKEEEVVHLNNYCVETSKVTGMDYTPLKKTAGVHHLNGVQTVAYARIRGLVPGSTGECAGRRYDLYRNMESFRRYPVRSEVLRGRTGRRRLYLK